MYVEAKHVVNYIEPIHVVPYVEIVQLLLRILEVYGDLSKRREKRKRREEKRSENAFFKRDRGNLGILGTPRISRYRDIDYSVH